MAKKAAVIFPGIGYHTDKPLLYYSKRLAAAAGFEVIEVPYGNFPKDIKGSPEKMKEVFGSAMEQCGHILQGAGLETYGRLLFISKSVGTAVAAAYAEKHGLRTCNIFYTPVEASLDRMTQPGIVFHGTADSWVDSERLAAECRQKGYEVFTIPDASHSLETGDVLIDLKNLETIMKETNKYILSL